jgi:hypothetical protein
VPPSSEVPLVQAMIPGAYERNTLTHRQAGSMSGPASGSTDMPIGAAVLSAATIADREREGGGGPSQRRRRSAARPQTRDAVAGTDHDEYRLQGVHAWFQLWWRSIRP